MTKPECCTNLHESDWREVDAVCDIPDCVDGGHRRPAVLVNLYRA